MNPDEVRMQAWDIPKSAPGFAIPHSSSFRSHMRKSARVYWYRWCAENLKRGDRISITFRDFDSEWDEQSRYRHVSSTHIDVLTSDGCYVGLPTCYIIAIDKIRESWDDEWL